MIDADIISHGKAVIDIESKGLSELKMTIGDVYAQIVRRVAECEGKVVLCGMGKSGHIARKIAATLSSLGISSFFLHPAEAQHGDMGMIGRKDLVIFISNSGETREIIDMLPSVKVIGAATIAITSGNDSTLAKECDIAQIMPTSEEACMLKLAPTSSTTNVLVFGDAVAVAASGLHSFTKEDFGLFHPAGTLGKKILIRVKDIMAKNDDVPLVRSGCRMTDAIMEMSQKTLGMLLIEDENDKLIGLLTDGDLRRAIEKHIDLYDGIVDDAMTRNPGTINMDMLAITALEKLKERHINNYPVIDAEGKVVGAITWQMIIRAGVIN